MSTIERPPRHLVSGPKDQFDMLHSTACAVREMRGTAKVPPLAPEPDLRIGVQPRSIPDGLADNLVGHLSRQLCVCLAVFGDRPPALIRRFPCNRNLVVV